MNHQIGGLGLGIGAGDRELDALVLADGSPKDLAFIRVIRRFLDKPARVANAFGSDQCSFGIHAVEDIAKSVIEFADQTVSRDHQVVEEHFGCGMIDHRPKRLDGQAIAQGFAHINQEHR